MVALKAPEEAVVVVAEEVAEASGIEKLRILEGECLPVMMAGWILQWLRNKLSWVAQMVEWLSVECLGQ